MRAGLLIASGLLAAMGLVPVAADAAPPAKKYQASITSPTTVTGATIEITKSSKVSVKLGTSSMAFGLKLSGVVDGSSSPVTLSGNTFQIDVVKAGVFMTKNITFDIVAGKVNLKSIKTNDDAGFWAPGSTVASGEPIEIRGARVVQMGGATFGVTGVTAK